MTIDTLSKNEKITLFGLVNFPTHNDRMLSDDTKLKMSTVTAIRNRLMREGYFRTMRIPFLERLGGELLVVSYTRLNLLKSKEEMQRILKEVLGGIDEVFFAFADQFGMLSFSFCRNYSDAWTDTEQIHQLLSDRGALTPRFQRQNVALFPLDQTKFLRFFDFSRILGERVGVELPDPRPQPNLRLEKAPPRHLSRLERKVYLGLVRFPELADRSIARRIGASRQSVTKIRKRFESEGLLAHARVPDILKMGTEMISMSSYEFAPGITLPMRKKGIEWSLRELPSFFQVVGSREGMIIVMERKFEDLQRHQSESARFFTDKVLLKDELRITSFAVRDLFIVKDFNFAPVVKKILGMDDERGK
jgi:DNA-binding MarR family transcriptional regulator